MPMLELRLTVNPYLYSLLAHSALLGAFKNPVSQAHDPIASNQISEICQWTNDIRFWEGKSNVVADWLSRPPETPLGTSYQLPSEEVATLEGVKLELVDSKELASEQRKCPNLKEYASTNITRYTMEFKTITTEVVLY